MKNSFFKITLLTLVVCSLLTWSSCTNSDSKEDSKDIAEEQNEEKFDNPQQKDAQFVVDAANISLAEIQLGQLAQSTAMMDHTKQLAQMLVNDHQKAYDALTALAKSKSISIPTSADDAMQKNYKKLADEKPSDFDKEYCDQMVAGHKDAINKFEKAANDATDTDVKNWANSMLPALRSHLDEAMKCQEECKAMESK